MFDLKACESHHKFIPECSRFYNFMKFSLKYFPLQQLKSVFYHWRSFLIPTMNGLSELIQIMQLLEKHNLTKAGFSIRQEVDG